MHDGDLDGLRTELCAIESNAESMREPQWMEPYATMEAELALRTDAMDEARTVLRRAAELIVRSEYATRLLRLAAHAERVEAEAAGRARALGEPYVPLLDEAIAALLARAEARPLPHPAEADAWALVARAERARRAFLLGEGTAGPADFEAAAAAFDALSLPLYAVYCRYRAAEAHVSAGDRVAAGAVLREAAAGAQATGSRLLAADVDGLARRARIDLADAAAHEAAAGPDDSPAARLGLTPRELEVLQLVALGHTNRAIGEELFMSEKTASVHVSRILGKLGVSGRVEAAAIAHRLGITSVSAAR
jgi:DNA-binding NarL/FixJ family response regulator